MNSCRQLMGLAFKAFKSGALDEAQKLAILAMAMDDSEAEFTGADALDEALDDAAEEPTLEVDILDQDSPVVEVEEEGPMEECEPGEEPELGDESLTDLLENGDASKSGASPSGGLDKDQQGMGVKGLYEQLNELVAELETDGCEELAAQLRACLEFPGS